MSCYADAKNEKFKCNKSIFQKRFQKLLNLRIHGEITFWSENGKQGAQETFSYCEAQR